MALPPVDDLVGWFFKLIVGAFISYSAWVHKKDKEHFREHDRAIIKLQSTSISEDKVRSIVKEEINSVREDLKEDMIDLKGDLKEIKSLVLENINIVNDIRLERAKEQGYKEALKAVKKRAG